VCSSDLIEHLLKWLTLLRPNREEEEDLEEGEVIVVSLAVVVTVVLGPVVEDLVAIDPQDLQEKAVPVPVGVRVVVPLEEMEIGKVVPVVAPGMARRMVIRNLGSLPPNSVVS